MSAIHIAQKRMSVYRHSNNWDIPTTDLYEYEPVQALRPPFHPPSSRRDICEDGPRCRRFLLEYTLFRRNRVLENMFPFDATVWDPQAQPCCNQLVAFSIDGLSDIARSPVFKSIANKRLAKGAADSLLLAANCFNNVDRSSVRESAAIEKITARDPESSFGEIMGDHVDIERSECDPWSLIHAQAVASLRSRG